MKRLKVLPVRRYLVPVMTAARVICPLCFILLSVASLTGTTEGLAERVPATSCVLWISSLAVTLIIISGRMRTQPAQPGWPSLSHAGTA